MARPRKPHNWHVIAGTARPDRHQPPEVDLPLLKSAPSPPDWLPNTHAVKEWNRLAPILAANGLLTEAGLMALAHLCATHGEIVSFRAAGMPVHASLLSQLRGFLNDFGLTPVAQGKVKPSGEEKSGNQFAKNGRRP